MTDEGLALGLAPLRRLAHLDLGGCSKLTDGMAASSLGRLTGLTALVLEHCERFGDEGEATGAAAGARPRRQPSRVVCVPLLLCVPWSGNGVLQRARLCHTVPTHSTPPAGPFVRPPARPPPRATLHPLGLVKLAPLQRLATLSLAYTGAPLLGRPCSAARTARLPACTHPWRHLAAVVWWTGRRPQPHARSWHRRFFHTAWHGPWRPCAGCRCGNCAACANCRLRRLFDDCVACDNWLMAVATA